MKRKEETSEPENEAPALDEMTPRQIVEELDKYIIGQGKAKRALAVAIRDRVRRLKLESDVADDFQPRNVMLIGPTGIGKTELARRLARLSKSPFLKVEASKFTEVGYVGRDVESIIRDLVEVGVEMVRREKASLVEKEAERNAEERLVEILAKVRRRLKDKSGRKRASERRTTKQAREEVRRELREGKLNGRIVELEIQERFFAPADEPSGWAAEDSDIPLREALAGLAGSRTFKRKMRVEQAIEYLISEEESKLLDMEDVTREALDRVEDRAIVFIDEFDKIAGRESGFGPDVSREGVQRDILPIVEGTAVGTRFGTVHTDRILFIAAGAFHVARPADLIPEIQGRFPVRIELDVLAEDDFREILRKPRNALIRQYAALMATEGIELEFTDDAIGEIARLAWVANETAENIGARRLHAMMEALLEEVSFEGPDLRDKRVVVDAEFVRGKLAGTVRDVDLSRYIL
jgi:ATP-dependent HslUV protease ATP-binding subunit HslU